MRTRMLASTVTLALLAMLSVHRSTVDACSCMPAHPQTHFCDADYAVVIRPMRKSYRMVPGHVAYKVQIKKTYKMNQDAHEMLKHGRIVTPRSDSSCGVNLEIGKLYMVAGRAPVLNMCSYIKEYLKMGLTERYGFSGAYQKGCKCNINVCFAESCLQQRETTNSCKWSPFAKCETEFGTCTTGVATKCHWRRTSLYKACLADP